jgi:hypothetical protein
VRTRSTLNPTLHPTPYNLKTLEPKTWALPAAAADRDSAVRTRSTLPAPLAAAAAAAAQGFRFQDKILGMKVQG